MSDAVLVLVRQHAALSRRERGVALVAVAPLLGLLALAPHGAALGLAEHAAVFGGALGVALGGALLARRPLVGRACVLLALFGLLVPSGPRLLTEPALAVLATLVVVSVVVWVFDDPHPVDTAVPSIARTAEVALYASGGGWAVASLLGWRASPAAASVFVTWLAASTLALGLRGRGATTRAWIAGLGLAFAGAALVALTLEAPRSVSHAALLAPGVLSSLWPRRDVVEAPSFWGRLLEHPARALVVTFFLLVVVGTLLLSLPQSAASGNPVSFVDAAFTSASAVCVTGLIVLDTPNAFSTSGLFFLILLIQVGGLGIMTFYTVALRALGRRVSVRHERVLAGALAAESRQLLYSSVRRVLLVTLVSEAAGAAILFLSFAARGEPLGTALGRAAFTAVSAFCNAGFALQSDSLIPYANDPIVLHVVGALIVLGGLSPVAVVALPRWSKRRRLPLQISIGVVTSALLLVSGALLYALIEWEASLGGLTTLDRLHNAWFQSVTLRTAGFNSVDLVETRPATQTLMLLFMLVGGSPGGTAGGIKTTTFAVLLMTVAATLRGLPETTMFGRRVGKVTVLRATAVATVGMVVALVALVAMELTQEIPLDVAVFEVVSALGTVGLSIGGTAMLDEVGKVIIMACMFAGRVGPLTLFLFLADERAAPPVEYPHEEVEVG